MDIVGASASILFGLVVGSFLNVVIYRVPRDTFLSGGTRSRCPHCDVAIAWFDNLPVVSYLLLRGRARCCGKSISPRYPIVEVLTAVAFLLVYLFHFPTLQAPTGAGGVVPLMLLNLFLVATLLAASAIDIEHRILPTKINYLGLAVGIGGSILVPELHAKSFLHASLGPDAPAAQGVAFLAAILGLVAGAGSLWLVAFVGHKIYGREVMGLGDVRFMAFTGTFIGAEGVGIAFLSASMLGSLVGLVLALKTGDPLIPFGPFLAAGVLLARFAHEESIDLLFVQWPEWIQTSPWALPIMIGISLFCLMSLMHLRRLRGKGD